MPSPAFCRIRGSPDRRRNGVPLRVSHGLPGSVSSPYRRRIVAVSSPNDCRMIADTTLLRRCGALLSVLRRLFAGMYR